MSVVVARVLPDVSGIDRAFDYEVPEALLPRVGLGAMVRVELHGRAVGGWVVAIGGEAPPGVQLKPIRKVTGVGPAADVVELTEWAAWRWAGRRTTLLRAASPHSAVPALASAPPLPTRLPASGGRERSGARAGSGGLGAAPVAAVVRRLPPTSDPVLHINPLPRPVLVVCPTHDDARVLAARLRRGGSRVALHPRDWALAAGGRADVVVGARGAVWASVPSLASIVVVDEHDEALHEERTPTWHARDVALERGRRLGVPVMLLSPCPSLEALAVPEAVQVVPSRNDEREGWPILEIASFEQGFVSDALGRALRSDRRVVCVLNRTGRGSLVTCSACRAVARCERCDAAVHQLDDGTFSCRRCATQRPPVCLDCGGGRFAVVRPGITRARADLEAFAGEPVVEVTGRSEEGPAPDGRIHLGTEAVLHRVRSADVVAFLDLDAELLAPRYRAAEEAMALLVRAARLAGRRSEGGRLLVQTRLGRHEVLDAVLHADPGRLVAAERARRELLGFPPFGALALVTGAGGAAVAAQLEGRMDVTVSGGPEQGWLVRAADHQALCGVLASLARPAERVRIEVDPLRL